MSSIIIKDKSYSVSVTLTGEYRLFSILPDAEEPAEAALQFLALSGGYIKNSMSVFRMSSSLLLQYVEDYEDPKFEKYIATLNHSYHSMLRMVNNISKYSLPLSDRPVNNEIFELVSMCEDLVDTVSHLTKERGIKLTLSTKEQDIFISGDKDMILTMLLNLLSNGLKYTPQGGSVCLGLSKLDKRVLISVSDTGDGIPPDVMLNVFARYRVERDRIEPLDGIGMGLAIVRKIAQHHNGNAVLESKPGAGTRVSIMLPLAEDGTTRLKSDRVDYGGSELSLILTELSDVLNTDCYSRIYID